MTRHHVDVRQLAGPANAWLNVFGESQLSGVGVWGTSYRTVTYLFQSGHTFALIQFETDAAADAWIEFEWPKWQREPYITPATVTKLTTGAPS